MKQQEGGGSVYGKHGRNLHKRYHCQYHWCESEAANRLLDFQFICRKKSPLICPLMTTSLHSLCLSLSLPCSFLPFICNKRPGSLTSCKALSISVSLFDLIPSSSPPPCLLCWILSLSPARSYPRYLSLSVVSLPVADMLQLNG